MELEKDSERTLSVLAAGIKDFSFNLLAGIGSKIGRFVLREQSHRAGVDITERKQLEQLAQEGMKRTEQITTAIVQNAPIGIVILDSVHRVTNANVAFGSMVGCDLEQLIDQPLASAMPGQAFKSVEEALMNGKPIQVSRVKVVRQGGLNYWDLSVWHVASNGKVSGTVVLASDSTDTVLLEQKRNDFVAGVAHDIKNPLVGAQRIFDALCNESLDSSPDKHATMLSVLRDSNQNLLSLVQNLVDVYRYETLSFPCNYEEVNLKPIIDSSINQVSYFAESRGVTVRSTLMTPLSIQSDSIGIRRVIMNLLHNAVKFNKQGGNVTVTVERLDDAVRMHISDTGDGISDSDQQNLFQRFVQGRDARRSAIGTGLGLYLCKQIVEALQGNIRCESKVGSGATFVITLPDRQNLASKNVSLVHQSRSPDDHESQTTWSGESRARIS